MRRTWKKHSLHVTVDRSTVNGQHAGEGMDVMKYGSYMHLLLGQIMLDVQNVLMHEVHLAQKQYSR